MKKMMFRSLEGLRFGLLRHCEECNDEAIKEQMDCRASLAMTVTVGRRCASEQRLEQRVGLRLARQAGCEMPFMASE